MKPALGLRLLAHHYAGLNVLGVVEAGLQLYQERGLDVKAGSRPAIPCSPRTSAWAALGSGNSIQLLIY